ncbi:unnamed protein product [Dicrocoelium dendriticum]|nr:unnamed protein product [Dicrocoelium dendriticum]
MPSKSWGCCPFPDAVCCSDGLHCCPKGYQCDPKDGECVKKTSAYAVGSGVTCPGAEFGCDNGSTCCPSGNGVWNCCPFEDAICCPDKEHCCPPDTVCDLENHRCVRSTSHRPNQFATSMDSSQHMQGACPGGLVACPHGTCCKDSSGVDACCPYPSAVCCSSGHCCPQGMQCDDTNGLCTPAGVTPQPEKASPHALPKREVSCPDGKSSCEADRTCCSLIDGSFGCCPFANGTCCSDKRHCCPAGSTCTEHGQCVHHLKSSFQRTTLVAEKMISALSPPAHLTQSPSDTVNSTDVVHATWCGYCANDWFCCPNAKGIRNQMCCPAAAGICCSDGEHCCPRGTRCTGDGHCEDSLDDLVMSLAPYLIAAKSVDGKAPSFIAHLQPHSFNLLIAKETSRARLDPLFLLDFYYYLWHDAVTVCPDRERYCPSDEQCCPSNKHGYTCAPVGATCCSPASETFCPSASTCSHDGLMCDY